MANDLLTVGLESGTIQPTSSSSTPPQQLVVLAQQDTQLAMTVGKIDNKLEQVEVKLSKIETLLDNVSSRIESIESLFNALVKIPKIGPVIDTILKAKIKKT